MGHAQGRRRSSLRLFSGVKALESRVSQGLLRGLTSAKECHTEALLMGYALEGPNKVCAFKILRLELV
jgi:hypothetical protein